MGVVMAKHVMNCLFGHSINLRLYDAAAVVVAAAAAFACASCAIQFAKLDARREPPAGAVKYATFYGAREIRSASVIKNHKK